MNFQKFFPQFKIMQELSDDQRGPVDRVDTPSKPQVQKPNLTPEQQKVFQSVESIQTAIETGKAGEKIVGTRASIIGAGLERIKNGLVDGATVDDPEYKEVLQTYNRLVEEYEAIANQQSQTSQVLDFYVSQLEGQANTYIEQKSVQPAEKPENTSPQKPNETQPQSRELTTEEKNTIDAEMKSETSKIAKKYGYNESAFYKAVNDITYNPKLSGSDAEGENTTKEEAIKEMEEVAKTLKDDPGMKNTPLSDPEKQDLVKKRETLTSLPQYAEIEKIQKDIDTLNRRLDITQRSINEEENLEKRQKLEETKKQILIDITNKNKEIESKKTDEYKKLEKEIEGLEGRVQQEVQTAIKVNTVGFGERLARNNIPSLSTGPSSQQNSQRNPILTLVNEIFKKIFGFDLFPENGGGGGGGNSSFDSGGLIGGTAAGELGSLSEHFESGGKGPEAITSNDAGLGFPSYGTYQMNRETLEAFSKKMGITGNHLEITDTGEFAQNWKNKIQEMGVEKFKEAERVFVREKYFDPQMKSIQDIGIDTSKFSLTMKNVIWSTAVQHGQSTDLITKILSSYKGQEWNIDIEKKVIGEIYDAREKIYPNGIKRFSQERKIALTQSGNFGLGIANIPSGGLESVPKRVVYNSNGTVKMTYCGETARANALRLGVSPPTNPGNSANSMFQLYNSTGKLSNQPAGKVFQVFSNSVRFPQLGHIATGYIHNGQAYVLDPYLMQTNKPVLLNDYKNRLASMKSPRKIYDNGFANIA